MPKKRLPALADRAVWEKVSRRITGIWWDNVANKRGRTWEKTKKMQRKVWGIQDQSVINNIRDTLALRRVNEEERLEIYGG